jgi:uncharacterized protein (TIGR02597 family)
LIAAAGLSATSLFAQSVTTAPVGAVTITIPAATAGNVKVTSFSPQLRLPTGGSFTGKARGQLTAVSSTTLTDTSAAWGAGALSTPAAPYFIKIRTGAASGSYWQISTTSANSASAVTVVSLNGRDPAAAGVVTGDTYEIVPGDTLDSFFASIEGSIGGTSLANADNVRLYDGTSWRNYYYNSSAGQWREGTSTFNRNSTIIRPDSGIIYTRRGLSSLQITLIGNVADQAEKFTVPATGVAFIGGVYPVDRQLSTTGLNTMPNFVPNTGNLAAADKVRFFDGTSWRTFNYNSAASQWREGTSTFNRNTFVVPSGTPLIIERGVGAPSGTVAASMPLPYTL